MSRDGNPPTRGGAETDAVMWTAGVESPVSKGNAQVEAPIGARDEVHFLLRTEEGGVRANAPLDAVGNENSGIIILALWSGTQAE